MNKQFQHWLNGFVEAEGNFQTNKKPRYNKAGLLTGYGIGYSFHMGMSLIDAELVNLIRANLGNIGTLHHYPNKSLSGEAHFAITRRADLVKFLAMLTEDHPLITAYQTMRMGLVLHGINNGIKSVSTLEQYTQFTQSILLQPVDLTNIDKTYFSNWLVGFFNSKAHFSLRGTFSLEHTDRALLEYIASFLSLREGAVRDVAVRPGRLPTYVLDLQHPIEVQVIVKFLEHNQPFKGHKLSQYTQWKKDIGWGGP